MLRQSPMNEDDRDKRRQHRDCRRIPRRPSLNGLSFANKIRSPFSTFLSSSMAICPDSGRHLEYRGFIHRYACVWAGFRLRMLASATLNRGVEGNLGPMTDYCEPGDIRPKIVTVMKAMIPPRTSTLFDRGRLRRGSGPAQSGTR
jgi:hypothetical protein